LQGFPVHQIKCKMALFYGAADALTDIQWLLEQVRGGPAGFPEKSKDEHLSLVQT
jgi:hypothetical protein